MLFFIERRLVFRPASPAESWIEPVDPQTRELWFADAKGVKLHAWWIPPADPSRGAFHISHGNSGNLSHRGQFAADLRRITGAGALVYDYPGYGKSEGSPTEDGCYDAGEAALNWLMNEGGIDPTRVVLLGKSLGGGVAVELATRHDHRALALFYTFTALPRAARYHYPWIATSFFMKTRFDNISKITRCTRPVFIAHGTSDRMVPFSHGEELFAAANEPKRFLRMEGESHGLPADDSAIQALADFLGEQNGTI